jgi:hypothetical protein
VTDQPEYDTFGVLVADIAAKAMQTLRANSKFQTISTLTGSHTAFRERCAVLLADIEFSTLLKLVSEEECGRWAMPEHGGTLEQALRFAVVNYIDDVYKDWRIDHCFEWAAGNLLATLERCAEAAGKVVSIRSSRDVASAGESIGRFLARVRNEGRIPQQDEFVSFLEARSTMFRPVVNDQWANWEALGRIGIDRPHLFELMTLVTNYVCLHNTDRERFLKLAADELHAKTSTTAHA